MDRSKTVREKEETHVGGRCGQRRAAARLKAEYMALLVEADEVRPDVKVHRARSRRSSDRAAVLVSICSQNFAVRPSGWLLGERNDQ